MRRRSSYSLDRDRLRSETPPLANGRSKRSPPLDSSPVRAKRTKRSSPSARSKPGSPAYSLSVSSPSESPSPARARGTASLGIAAKSKLERELQVVIKEKERVQAELDASQETIDRQTDVIEKIRSHAASRRVQMKALSQRSQKRCVSITFKFV